MSSGFLKKFALLKNQRGAVHSALKCHPFLCPLHILETSRCKNKKEDILWYKPHKAADPAFQPHPAGHGARALPPELEEELKECLFCLRRNEMMFDLETDTDLIEQRIYERQALLARYRYLLSRARELGLHTILQKYQPLG